MPETITKNCCFLCAGAWKHHDKFFSAPARHHVLLSTIFHQEGSKSLEYLVSGVMTKGIVDGLEVVQVGHDDGQGSLVPLNKGDGALQALQEAAPVGDASQRVSAYQSNDAVMSYPQAVETKNNSPQAQKPQETMSPPEAHGILRPQLGQVPPKG